MTSTHHEIHRISPVRPRPPRCLRHRVWIAVCDDCRAAHAEQLRAPRDTATAAD